MRTELDATARTTALRNWPPGPAGWPWLGSAPALAADPLGFLARTASALADDPAADPG
jgi:hypothetical protein